MKEKIYSRFRVGLT